MLPEHRDQPVRLTGDLVDDGAEICFAHYDIVEPNLPDRRGAGVDQRGGDATQQLEQLQTCCRRHHKLAVGSEQVLAFEALDDWPIALDAGLARQTTRHGLPP